MEPKELYPLLGSLALARFTATIRQRSKASSTVAHYTPHQSGHFAGVADSVALLLAHQKASPDSPTSDTNLAVTEVEKLILKFCAWGHDVGMIDSISHEYHSKRHRYVEWSRERARKWHDAASASFIVAEIDRIQHDLLRTLIDEPERETHRTRLRDYASHSDLPQGPKTDALLTFLQEEENRDSIASCLTNLAYTITLIASFHRRHNNINECPVFRDVLGQRIRARMLAAIFRLGDALHIDRSRFAVGQYETLRHQPDFSPESRRHWMKSFLVSAIGIDPETHSVDIQIDLPEGIYPYPLQPAASLPAPTRTKDLKKAEKRGQMIDEMCNFIVNDLEEDVLSVCNILLEYGFPPLLRVNKRIDTIPAMDYEEDIWTALQDLHAAASPNTSQLIQSALTSIRELLSPKVPKDSLDAARSAAVQRLLRIEDQLSQRPCHEGLKKIADLLRTVVAVFDSNNDQAYSAVLSVTGTGYISQTDLFALCLDGVYGTLVDQRVSCSDQVANGMFDSALAGFRNVVVYGYSDQVISILQRMTTLRLRPTIHVLECRTKTMHTANGRLIYLDGQRYAVALRDQLGSDGIAIHLTPDSAVGRILENARSKAEKTLILLGSNAITERGGLVHSMGHITVAAVAKAEPYKNLTQVYVLTDGLKIGGTQKEVEDHLQRQRHEQEWLTHNRTIVSMLSKKDIQMNNWLEDLVPFELIDKILVLDRGVTIGCDQGPNRVAEYGCECRRSFCNKLHVRLIASRVRNDLAIAKGLEQNAHALNQLVGIADSPETLPNLDDLSYVIAERAVRGELATLSSSMQAVESWNAIRRRAEEGMEHRIEEAMAQFIREFMSFGARDTRSSVAAR